jgi:hypothetical protein
MATTSTMSTRTRTEKGVSLARGPALILGTILEVAGLYFLYKQHGFPKLSNFPNGDAPVQGKVFLGIFGANGWTGLFTAAAGGLLLFGAAQHLLAKTMSLIVGLALGAAAVIAVISSNVLGLAAANGWTRLGWGVCAIILLFNTLVPRRTRTIEEPVADDRPPARQRMASTAPVSEPATRTQATDQATRVQTTEPAPRAQATEAPTRADGAETEPLVTSDREATDGEATNGEATGPERAGPVDDRGAVHDPSAETAAHERPPE